MTTQDLIPHGLVAPQYAALALACLDQAGCPVRLQDRIRGMLEREGVVVPDGWQHAHEVKDAPEDATYVLIADGEIVLAVESDEDEALYVLNDGDNRHHECTNRTYAEIREWLAEARH